MPLSVVAESKSQAEITNNLKNQICNGEPSSILHLHDRKSIDLAMTIVSRKKAMTMFLN